ncbi:hypothetical protein [Streptomyces acidiscabies]|uniref:Secreted protein n=1 Tax=Streptomyces acidiscabies TaxID=42234 RepID=A0AAP6BBB8_9ACTN|nr:hypothetical protein [Streptomyces acidiscabies]MBZ3909080.1 hypothetical protein [Streptomyces acidiscabies]MDX2961619.1 hypothetical protein [Streptomyces acidiscabies]MDX3016513.1 hypothetical protein [Streptomyces acidiscabies]MDX3788582.1 hypothetical protein [Streptomyces acidiscabies]GAV41393.1 hypothetical protein Saa2_04297 [Streptomyces acidiscabies]
MPGSLRVRLAVTIGALACTLVACGAEQNNPGSPPTGVSGTGSEAGSGTGSGASPAPSTGSGSGQSTGSSTSCDPSTSTTPEDASTASGTAPGDSQTHTQDPADNCVIDSGIPNMPVDP